MAEKALTVQILADTADAERGIGNVAEKTGGMSEAFKNAAALAATYLAGKALAAVRDFVGDSVRAYSDLNETLNAVEVVYGGHADGVKKLGEQAARSIGSSNAEFNQYAVSISAFAEQIAGDGGDVVDVVDTLSKRTADFASVMNLDFGEASAKFQSGLAGQSEPLRAFGIDVSAARVEAQALADGIWDGTGAMTESEKVQARFAAIMEQTEKVQGDFANTAGDFANAQRIAAAETENMKAKVGESLVPFERLRTEVELLAAKTLGIFATQIQQLTGGISAADSAITQFEIHMGQSADTAEAALTIMAEYGVAASDLIPRLGLTRDELIRLRDADQDFLESIGFTKDEVAELADVVTRQLAAAMTDQEKASREASKAIRDLADAEGEQADATRDAADALKEKQDQYRAMSDPLFGVIKATNDLEKAERDYQTAVDEGDTDAQIAAIGKIQDANIDLRATYQSLVDQGIDPTSEAARQMFRDVGGLSPQQIDLILGTFRSIQGRMPILDLKVLVPSIEYRQRANSITPHTSREVMLAEGGIARHRPGGIAARIAEGGADEVVSPLDELLGMIRDTVRGELGNGGGGRSGGVIELRVDATRSQPLDGWAIIESLQRVEQTAGPLPIRVRT